jgi:hypothetical protein
MILWKFLILMCIIKDKKYWLLVLKNSSRRDFLAPGSNGKLLLSQGKKQIVPLMFTQLLCQTDR